MITEQTPAIFRFQSSDLEAAIALAAQFLRQQRSVMLLYRHDGAISVQAIDVPAA